MLKKLLKCFTLVSLSALFISPIVANNICDEEVFDDVIEEEANIKLNNNEDYSISTYSSNAVSFFEHSWGNADVSTSSDGSNCMVYTINDSRDDNYLIVNLQINNSISSIYKFCVYFSELNSSCDGSACFWLEDNDDSSEYNQNFIYDCDSGSECFEENGDSSTPYNYNILLSDVDTGYINVCIPLDSVYDGEVRISWEEVDTIKPVVSTSTYTLSLPVKTSTRITTSYLLNSNIFKVIDETDGDITSKMVIKETNLTEDKYNEIGVYYTTLSWSDKADNSVEFTLNVLIGDFEAPKYSVSNDELVLEFGEDFGGSSGWTSIDDLKREYLDFAVDWTDNYSDVSVEVLSVGLDLNKCNYGDVVLRGTDTSGNYTDVSITVVIEDTNAPYVQSNSIVNGGIYKNLNCTIGDSGIGVASYVLDGKTNTITNDNSSVVVSINITGSTYKDGSHTIYFVDKQGNKSSTYTFTFDNSAPSVSGITNNGKYNKSFNVSISDSYSNIASYVLNGNTIKLGTSKTSSITLTDKNLNQGSNYITSFTDSLGNVNSTKYTFTFDNVAPVITPVNTTSLSSGEYLTDEKILAQFSAKDNVDSSVSCYIVSNESKDRVGVYDVVIGAKDSCGNVSKLSISVERLDVVVPVIFFTSQDEVVIKAVDGTNLTYANLLTIFKSLYIDSYNFNDENISVVCLCDSLLIEEETKVATYVVSNLETGDEDTIFIEFESYTLNVSDDDSYDNLPSGDNNSSDDSKNDNSSTDDNISKDNWFVSILKWIWNLIKKFFSWIGSLFSTDENFVKLI